MVVAIVIILLVLGTVVFHIWSPWWFTPISSNWGMIDDTVHITVWVTGIVFIAVNLFMAYAILRYRHREGARAHYEPENKRLEIWLTVATTVGIVAMLAPGLFVWAKFIAVPDDAMEVEAVGQQWLWTYRFPGEDGVFGTTAPKHFSPANPFGMNPGDPRGQDDVLIADNELHLPLHRPVKVNLRSKDVLHDFAVPQFRVKMDMVPGMVTYFWLEPTREGTFDVLCQELCGIGHYLMRGQVVVENGASFDQWLAAQPTYADTVAARKRDVASGKQQYLVCASCHGQQGEGNKTLNAPKLAGLDEGYIARQLRHFREGVRGASPEDPYGMQMAPMARVLPDDTAVQNVAAYIATLDPGIAEKTVTGDIHKGRVIFENCAVCHGAQGAGIWSTHAPRLANMDDWYLVRQLENFRAGLRGTHPDDSYGQQMTAMTAFLGRENDISNVVAYINSLEVPDNGEPKMTSAE